MKDAGYAIIGLAILAIAVLYTVYTVLVIYDIIIDINIQTVVSYFIAVCFIASVVYRHKGKKKKESKIKGVKIDKDLTYPDSLYN